MEADQPRCTSAEFLDAGILATAQAHVDMTRAALKLMRERQINQAIAWADYVADRRRKIKAARELVP